jgi:hypothetical protein
LKVHEGRPQGDWSKDELFEGTKREVAQMGFKAVWNILEGKRVLVPLQDPYNREELFDVTFQEEKVVEIFRVSFFTSSISVAWDGLNSCFSGFAMDTATVEDRKTNNSAIAVHFLIFLIINPYSILIL